MMEALKKPSEDWASYPDRYSISRLCDDLESMFCVGSAAFDRQVAKVFGRAKIEPWTRKFEAAAKLFDEEFGRGQKGWKHGDNEFTRECYMNGCNGISWSLTDDETDAEYHGSGETDALSLCVAMIRAKFKLAFEE